jgi:ribose 5-phosphate isomerase A
MQPNGRVSVSEATTGAEALKQAAAIRAADFIASGMSLGLGTGSTIRYLLEELAARLRSGALKEVRGVPTSEETRRRATELGIPLVTLDESSSLDLTIDGADEVDPELRLIKGLGGALLREKIVAAASHRLVIIVDGSKIVQRLGTRSPLPVEVDPFGAPIQPAFLRALGADPVLRRGDDGAPRCTDGGNLIFDCRFPDGIADPESLESTLNNRPGVLENGLFLGMADHVVVARPGGSELLSRRER